MRCSWTRLTLGLVVLLALLFHLRHLADPWRFDGDARQHVFWTYRFADPGLFPGDPLVRFISSPKFDPPGYAALYAVGARVLDPLLFSKLLAVLLAGCSGWLAWRIGRRLGGEGAGFLFAALVGAILFDDHRGGLPRSFGFPLVFLYLDALVARRPLGGGLAVLLASLFYPPVIVLMAACAPAWLRTGSVPGASRLGRRGVLLVLPFALAAAGILAWSYLQVDREFTGPMVTAEQARAMPEFNAGGRAAFWDPDPVTFWLGDGKYSRSACGLFSSNVLYGAVLVLALLAWRRRRFRAPAELVWWFTSALALFLLAHAVLFALFQPSRYPMYGWPPALLGLAALNLAALLEAPLDRLRVLLAGRRGLVVFLVLLAVIAGVKLAPGRRRVEPGRLAVMDAIAALPKDALIAGVPERLDDVPLMARRSVLVNRELALPYYTGYYARVRERYHATIDLLMARDAAEVRRVARRFGVTHLLVDPGLYEGERPFFGAPFEARYRELLAAPGTPLFATPDHGFRELWRDDRRVLVEL